MTSCSGYVDSLSDFKAIFLNTPEEDLYVWITDLEKADQIRKKTKKPLDLEHASKLRNQDPLSLYGEDGALIHKKIENFLDDLELKETEAFHNNRILIRIGCEQEEKDFLVIYDDLTAKIIHMDKNANVEEKCYRIESEDAVEALIAFVDQLIEPE